jgi:hypothetical protein
MLLFWNRTVKITHGKVKWLSEDQNSVIFFSAGRKRYNSIGAWVSAKKRGLLRNPRKAGEAGFDRR